MVEESFEVSRTRLEDALGRAQDPDLRYDLRSSLQHLDVIEQRCLE